MSKTLFQKIIAREIPARIAHEDELCLALQLLTAGELARKLGVAESGYRLAINNGRDAGESVPHLHVHLLGGRPLAWPPG